MEQHNNLLSKELDFVDSAIRLCNIGNGGSTIGYHQRCISVGLAEIDRHTAIIKSSFDELMECDNWKQLNNHATTWQEFVKLEVSPKSKEAAQIIYEHMANRMLPKELHVKGRAQIAAINLVPDHRKEDVIKAAMKVATVNKFTGKPQLSGILIENVALGLGVITEDMVSSKKCIAGRGKSIFGE